MKKDNATSCHHAMIEPDSVALKIDLLVIFIRTNTSNNLVICRKLY